MAQDGLREGGNTLKYSSSSSTLVGDRSSGAEAFSSTMRRLPERMHSGKTKKDGIHSRSQSRHHHHGPQQELKTVGEYALHHLFNAFVAQADQKITLYVAYPRDAEPRVELVCGPGIDPAFDQLISALGHIARQKPKPLIDTLMYWRKAKSEVLSNARAELSQIRGATPPANPYPRRVNTAPINGIADPNPSTTSLGNPASVAAELHVVVAEAERRSTVAIYLLCRVLIEIISQSTLENVTPDMEDRLEHIIYDQMKSADADSLEESPLKYSNWIIYGQLLGVMSEISFSSVTAKFLADLEKAQKHLSVKGVAGRDVEVRTALIIRSMKYLKIRFTPEDVWDRSCDFIQSLATCFAAVHGQIVKYAYCQILEQLLIPLAGSATSELNIPKWKAVVETISPRLSQLLAKPKHWHVAFPLKCVLLSSSPVESFSTQWHSFAMSLTPKLKERSTRPMALQGICRLVWTYLYTANSDSQNITARKIDEIIKLVFQGGRRSYLSTETAIAEPMIQLIRIIGFKLQDQCFKSIIFPFLNADAFSSGRELKVETLEPERMVIGIRAFLAILTDLEMGEQPAFPRTFEAESSQDQTPLPSTLLSPRPFLGVSAKSSAVKEDRLSRPVIVGGFSKSAKDAYTRFCKILGEITLICDNTFGGQAALDEKFSSQTPKTPMSDAFNFARREENNIMDTKQGFYDLLHVAVQALPRCLSPHIQFNSLVNLLCTGTAHVQSNIATSSAQSLKSIAKQMHAQPVTIGFARFIFNFDDRYSTMSDGGLLGHGHIESTLSLYVELLQIWIEEIQTKMNKAAAGSTDDESNGNRGAQLDLSAIVNHVDEIESHGLFFLCSPSRRVRAFAVTVLKMVTEFDTVLNKDSARLIRIIEGNPANVIDINDGIFSVPERSRLERGTGKPTAQSTFVELCSSDVAFDSSLWFKLFPHLIRLSFESCPMAVTLTRNIVCARLAQMQKAVGAMGEGPRANPYSAFDATPSRSVGRLGLTPSDAMVEQWKLYLVFACTTLTNLGGEKQLSDQPIQHTRKSSKSSQQSQEKVHSAADLFARVIPLLSVSNTSVRDAVVTGLGSINSNLYRTLLESLQPVVAACLDDAKGRLGTRIANSARRNKRVDILRTEITHIYKLTSHFLVSGEALSDEWVLNNLVVYTKELQIFLNDAEVQNEWEFQKLRTHYCGLVESLFGGINKTKDPLRWMSFNARKAAFTLMEEWSGFSPNQIQVKERENMMRRSMLDREQETGNRGIATAAMEIEKKELKTAALSAMATLCGGPVSITTDSKVNLQFDVQRMLSWIDTIFETVSDRTHAIGRRALRNLITHNREHPYLLERSLEMCYISKSAKALESYFTVVTEVYTDDDRFTTALPFWKVICACLYTLGNESSDLRMKSTRLLRFLEGHQQKNSKLQDLDISISDKTTAVYKLAQFELSRRLAKQHTELAFHVFSEFCLFFKDLQPDRQRGMVAAMLPWIQVVELQVDPLNVPTAPSYMLLVNLFEITVRSSNVLYNEIQALWQALATGPFGGNVKVVFDFIINLCLERREQNLVDYAKQIVVFLSATPAGSKVVEFLLQQITTKTILPGKGGVVVPPADSQAFPYLADLANVLPVGSKQAGFALAHLCLILLVDLIVAPGQIAPQSVPLLLLLVIGLWDHYTPMVQEQARELLVHLIHEVVISQTERTPENLPQIEAAERLIERIRHQDSTLAWYYEDSESKEKPELELHVPDALRHLVSEILAIFSPTCPEIQESWPKITLYWATQCSVRHVACRSFQIFRCIISKADQGILADMLARLSNTISDDKTDDTQPFSMEILITLRCIIKLFGPEESLHHPQLFWTICACLDTIHEKEFMEVLTMLDCLLDVVDLSNTEVLKALRLGKPEVWLGTFEGLQPLVYKGIRSSVCFTRSLKLLSRLVALPSSDLVGNDSRLLFAVLAHLPMFLQYFDERIGAENCIGAAELLADTSENQGLVDLSRALRSFAASRFRNSKDFLQQIMSTLRAAFFPDHEFACLTFLISLLTNKLAWFKIKTMQILCVLLMDIDLKKPEISIAGPDLVSPLLRLLQTEFCPQALQVLDHIMLMAGTPMDKHHVRMSMAGSHSSKAFRKEYEKTQCLYGIPVDSGWAIPMPKTTADNTHANMRAVFVSCHSGKALQPEDIATPEVEFHQDEFQNGSYFPTDRSATMLSEDGHTDTTLGELALKLNSLDDFFDDDDEPVDSGDQDAHTESFPDFASAGASFDLANHENTYEQQTLPILHKSLARNASVTSLHTGFSDFRPSHSANPSVMTPTSFAAAIAPPPIPQNASRPSLHNRSVTSPVVQVSRRGTHEMNSNKGADPFEPYEEPFSDDETRSPSIPYSAGAGQASADKPFFLENMIRPFQGTRTGFRTGMRRLTGGSGSDGREKDKEKQREAIRQQLMKSPKVPKVPEMYLQNPKSSDL